MNAIDVAIVAILLVSLLIGLRRGFIREILSLVSWIAALWAAYVYVHPVEAMLEGAINQPLLRVIAAFAAIFVVVLFAVSLLGHLLCRLLSVSGITGVDRSLGMLFGFVRGALIVAVGMLMAVFMDFAAQPWWQESLLVNLFTPVADLLIALMPHDMALYFHPRDGIG